MLPEHDWSNDENWSTRILELFDVGHIPKTIGAREAVALFILGKYGSSRKTPNERAADYKVEADRFVGKLINYKERKSMVLFLSVMDMNTRTRKAKESRKPVGLFTAYIGQEGYLGAYVPTARLELADNPKTSE